MTAYPVVLERIDDLLTFDRTLDRCMVHRQRVSEVFLTDLRVLDGSRVLLGAQLPTCHGYFNDHIAQLHTDPLLIMEIGRQATLATAHALGVATDAILISADVELKITNLGALTATAEAVTVESHFTWTRMRRGLPRAGVCEQVIRIDGQLVATHRSSGQLLSGPELQELRRLHRQNEPPWTADLPDQVREDAVAPGLVGRVDPRNVVLAALNRDHTTYNAVVSPRLSNRALFDHSYDHVTMQVLIEAARQLAHVSADSHLGAGRELIVVGIDGSFARFAELDAPVTIEASEPRATDGHLLLDNTVHQSGERIAGITVTLRGSREGS